MSKEVVAVDVDEVLFPFVQEFCVWHNQEYGTSFLAGDFHSYEFSHVLGLSVPETVNRVHAFLDQEDSHDDVSPIGQSVDGVHKLSERFSIVPVTARHPKFREVTERYLDEYFGGVFRAAILVGHTATVDVLRTKAEVCLGLGARGLIDDSIDHVTSCVEQNLDGVLFGNYAWNRSDDLHPEITRCETWPKVLAHYDIE